MRNINRSNSAKRMIDNVICLTGILTACLVCGFWFRSLAQLFQAQAYFFAALWLAVGGTFFGWLAMFIMGFSASLSDYVNGRTDRVFPSPMDQKRG